MAAIESIALNKSTLALKVGANETLTVEKTPQDGEGTITWESSDPTVATVDGGVVTAVKAGTATITASAGESITDTCEVTVSAVEPEPEPEPDPEPDPEPEEDPDLTFMDDGKIPMGILYVNTVKNIN